MGIHFGAFGIMWGLFWFIFNPFGMHRGIWDHLVARKKKTKTKTMQEEKKNEGRQQKKDERRKEKQNKLKKEEGCLSVMSPRCKPIQTDLRIDVATPFKKSS